jgi:hypothetical protein
MKIEIVIEADFEKLAREEDRIEAIIPAVKTAIKCQTPDEFGNGENLFDGSGVKIVDPDGDMVGSVTVNETLTLAQFRERHPFPSE